MLVDEVLALAAAVNAAADLHLVGLGGQRAAAVVKGHGDFGHAEAAPGRRAVEDDVGHLAAAQALGALLAQHPAHGIDHVALARAVGADDAGDSGREVELGFVRERFEADQFQALEHGRSPGGEVVRW